MQKALRLAIASVSFVVVPMAAQAEGQAFINASGGQARTNVHATSGAGYDGDYGIQYNDHVDKKGAAFGITAGYRWDIDEVFSIGPEAGLVDLGKVKESASASQFGTPLADVRDSASKGSALLGVNAKWILGYNWTLGVRAGYMHTWTKVKESDTEYYTTVFGGNYVYDQKYKRTVNDDGFYSSATVGYNFTRHFGVGVGYDYYHGGKNDYSSIVGRSTGVWAVSAEVRF